MHQKQLAQMSQVLFPNTSVFQGAYDSLSKVKLTETIYTFHSMIQMYCQLSPFCYTGW